MRNRNAAGLCGSIPTGGVRADGLAVERVGTLGREQHAGDAKGQRCPEEPAHVVRLDHVIHHQQRWRPRRRAAHRFERRQPLSERAVGAGRPLDNGERGERRVLEA
eukprot:6468913-Prymnesium_polylepis.1